LISFSLLFERLLEPVWECQMGEWGLHFLDYSIDRIAPGKLNQAQHLKDNRHRVGAIPYCHCGLEQGI
jgi:hypothetical protein